jgi:hypothetical protein
MNADEKHKEWRRRLIAEKYLGRLSSNTKWRELFSLLSDQKVFFDLTWISGERFSTFQPLALDLVQEWGLADPGVGSECGPFEYADIERLTVRGIHKYSKYHEVENDLDTLASSIEKLGQISKSYENECLTIYGYQLKVPSNSSLNPDLAPPSQLA